MMHSIERKTLIPTTGCFIETLQEPVRRGLVTGRVREVSGGQIEVLIDWGKGSSGWASLNSLRPSFRLGSHVLEVPSNNLRKSLGIGLIASPPRRIGGRYQLLVDFPESGNKTWLPFESLQHFWGVRERFLSSKRFPNDHTERLRLRNLAYALDLWHQNTGALLSADIDPLPHQIYLVHHILKSGNLNWLIADDVGLGKTIEVGMLLSAISKRLEYKRVLIVCPAGLVKQWKDELYFKFGLHDFRIYGDDFSINESRDWHHYDKVIASLDRLKNDDHLQLLMSANDWGLVIFDEAHRLSRMQQGLRFVSSARFDLAKSLRKRTESMLLLSATPHQGKSDKFKALLELIRPDWVESISTLELNPEILSRMVIRNNKADVTDVNGELIFKGKHVQTLSIPISETERNFDRLLVEYLRKGYAATEDSNPQTRAIGFVMTVYRKLAASSMQAISNALRKRLKRVTDGYREKQEIVSALEDSPFTSELEELGLDEINESLNEQFFEGEAQLLRTLNQATREIIESDSKTHFLTNELVPRLLSDNPDEKILIFTEYRSTQSFLADRLSQTFGSDSVSLIHGGMDHDERSIAIEHFENDGKFLISTEAGGEGINLQRRCHIMVNFDLPWNPMRLVQRIGRLYRYGQVKQVRVFNLFSPETLDGEILKTLYERLAQVAADMANVTNEFKPGFEDDILGQLADTSGLEEILEASGVRDRRQTQSQIDTALERARQAVEMQRELFESFAHFDPKANAGELRLDHRHVQSFVLGMAKQLGIAVIDVLHGGRVALLQLPEDIRETLGLRSSNLRVCFDREYSSKTSKTEMMDFDSAFLQFLFQRAKDQRFGGYVAMTADKDLTSAVTAILRWQGDVGYRQREEYIAICSTPDGKKIINPDLWSDWLLSNDAIDVAESFDKTVSMVHLNDVQMFLEHRLSEISNVDLHPENRQIISAISVKP